MRRGRLARKYMAVLVSLVAGVLAISGAIELRSSYVENKAALVALQREKANNAAASIEGFVREIERQLVWTTQPSSLAGRAALEERRLDAIRLLRQAPAVTDVSHLDAAGREQVRVSRVDRDDIGSGTDYSTQPKFLEARRGHTWFGPVYFRKESEPYMTIALPQSGGGVTAAEVNLKFIWDVVSQIRIGKTGLAYAVDRTGALIAHPDISLVLQKTSLANLEQVRAALAPAAGGDDITLARDVRGRDVLTAHSRIPSLGWVVFVEQPVQEAFAPVRASAWRIVVLVALGIAFSAVASVVLARRLARPIQALQESASRIGAGELDHRISIRTGDELEALADQFNDMTGRLRESYATLEQKVEDRTRELREALEQQTATAEILKVISSSPTDVQPVLDAVAESAARLCGATDALIHRVEDGQMVRVAHFGPVPVVAPSPVRPATSGTPSGRAIVEARTIHVHDVVEQFARGEYAEARQLQEGSGFRTVLCTPLVREGVAIGVIVIRRMEVRPFTDKQIALLQTFADQAVIAIENVRLFQELEARNSELAESLEQQTATAEILRVISSSPTDVQPVFEAILANATRLCGAEHGILNLYDGEAFTGVAFRGLSAEAEAVFRARGPKPGPASGLGRMLAARRPVQVADVTDDPAYRDGDPLRVRTAQLLGARTAMWLPLLKGDVVIGGMAIYRREVRPFTDKQVELVATFADQAVIAIENVRLFKELQARNAALADALEQQTATGEILRVISGSQTDVQPVFEAIAVNASRLCGGARTSVLRYDGRLIHRIAATGGSPELREEMARLYPRAADETSLVGRAIVRRTVIHAPDVSREAGLATASLTSLGIGAQLSVPMLHDGKPIGVIAVSRAEPGPFNDKQIELIKTFADQAVIAIENVRLFTELEEKNAALGESLEQQTATGEILRAISGSPTDVQPVFDTIVRSALRLLDGRTAMVLRVAGGELQLAAVTSIAEVGAEEAVRGTFPVHLSKAGPAWHVVDKRRPYVIADTETDPVVGENIRRTAPLRGYRSMVLVPMLREGRSIGVIAVTRAAPGGFSADEVELLQTFADQAVIAIENVRLFTELDARNADLTEALERQTATADVLRVISGSQTEVEPVFAAIATSAARLCNGARSGVFLYDGELVHFTMSSDPTPERLAAMRRMYPRPAGEESLVGRAITRRSVIHTPDVANEPGLLTTRTPEFRAVQIGAQISVPMLRDGKPVGAIAVTRPEPGPFTDKQIALLQIFADQAVIAIENVRLFKELQARTADLTRSVTELEALGEVGRTISSTLDLDRVLETIVSRANELAGTDGGAIYEFDAVTRAFNLRATDNFAEHFVAELRSTRLAFGEGAVGRAAAEQRPVQIADVADSSGYESRVRDLLLRSGYRSLLAVPLLSEGEVVGALVVNRRVPGEFPARVVELLRTFATQSALAIGNARLFREIEDKSRQLEAANRHKDEFLASMSHELRTPLNAVIGFSEVLLERMFGELNPKQEEYLNDILASGRHLLSLINDILDLAKIEAGRMELDLEDFDLAQAVDNALVLIRERALRKGLALDTKLDDGLGQVRGDQRKIKQVLLNLLSNAVKFTPEGGRVEVRGQRVDGHVEIAVSDTGIGIAAEDQEAVFEEFRQVGTDYTKKHEGTGLGLTLSRKFVELHGGRIWLKSQPGHGSTFTFTLPVPAWPTSAS